MRMLAVAALTAALVANGGSELKISDGQFSYRE